MPISTPSTGSSASRDVKLLTYDKPFVYETLPRAHQFAAYKAAYGREYFALFMEQGTGKSKIVIDLMTNYFLEGKIDAVMLIAPSGVHEQWFDEQLPEHSPIGYAGYVWEGFPSSNKKLNALRAFVKNKTKYIKWFFINVEAFSSDGSMAVFRTYIKRNRCAVIVDEATTIKNTEAHCTINIAQNLNELEKAGKRIVSIQMNSLFRMLLTGTMVTNNPFDQYSYGEFLSPGLWGMNFYGFKAHFGMVHTMKLWGQSDGKGGVREITNKVMNKEDIAKIKRQIADGFRLDDIAYKMGTSFSVVNYLKNHPECEVPYKNLAELKEKINTFAYVVRKEDCYDLPPKQKLVVSVRMSKEQNELYNDLIADHYAEFNDRSLEVTTKLAMITRLAQITGGFFPSNDGEPIERIKSNGKIVALKREVEELDERPLIICARFTAEIDWIAEELEAVKYYGPVPRGEPRREIIARYKAGEIPILVVQPAICEYGFNFQIGCNEFFYSNSYSIDTREQMEDRIHRDGQKSDHIVYKDFITKNSVDERIYEVLKDKKDLLAYMREPSIREFLGGEVE